MGSEKQHHFVLVHGGGHGAWCWVKLVPELEKAGHRVTAIDLLGAGDNVEVAPEDITSPEQYDGPLAKIFEKLSNGENVILVGHSLGGLSLARMSEKYPEKISVAIYLAAATPGISKESHEIMRDPKYSPLRQGMMNSKSSGEMQKSIEIPPAVLKEFFYNKCSPEDLAFAAERVRPFSLWCTTLAVQTALTAENFGRVPKLYVIARDDKVFLAEGGRKSVEINHPAEWFEVDGDHSLFFSVVESVAAILNDAAAKYDSR